VGDIRAALRHPVVRLGAAAIFLYGFAGAATSPFQSVVAITGLGLGDRAYAALILIAAFANVALSIGVGLFADRLGSYRMPLLAVSAAGVLGYGAIWLWPSAAMFVLAMIGPLAVFHALNPLLFGTVRARTAGMTAREVETVSTLMRMMISLAWVLTPGLVALALRGQPTMLPAWAIAAGGVAVGGALIALALPPEPKGARPPASHPASRDLIRLVAPGLLARVLGVALVSQVLHVNAAVLPLIVTGQAGGTSEDIGLIVGLVAVLEAIFMLVWAALIRRVSLSAALLVTAVLYMVYLMALAYAVAPWQVYAASLVGGFAAASIILLPLGYLLGLIEDRPALSASLIAVNSFAGAALGAGVFAAGTAIGGYPGAAVLSGLAGVMGAALIAALERRGA